MLKKIIILATVLFSLNAVAAKNLEMTLEIDIVNGKTYYITPLADKEIITLPIKLNSEPYILDSFVSDEKGIINLQRYVVLNVDSVADYSDFMVSVGDKSKYFTFNDIFKNNEHIFLNFETIKDISSTVRNLVFINTKFNENKDEYLLHHVRSNIVITAIADLDSKYSQKSNYNSKYQDLIYFAYKNMPYKNKAKNEHIIASGNFDFVKIETIKTNNGVHMLKITRIEGTKGDINLLIDNEYVLLPDGQKTYLHEQKNK